MTDVLGIPVYITNGSRKVLGGSAVPVYITGGNLATIVADAAAITDLNDNDRVLLIRSDGTTVGYITVGNLRNYLQLTPPNDINNTTYTFATTDVNKIVRSLSGSPTTFTVPTNATVPFTIGSVIGLERNGTGTLTIAAAVGVTVNSLAGALSLNGRYAQAALTKTDTNVWTLVGAIS